MARSLSELSDVIGAIYDAGLDESASRWPAVLDRLSHLLGGGAPACLALERRSFSYARVLAAGIGADAMDRYTAYYARREPVIIPRLARAGPGEVVVGSERVPLAELRRGEFYADFGRAQDMLDCAAAVLLREGSASASLFVTRTHRARAFGREPLALLTTLLPHVARAAQAGLALAGLGAERDDALQALGGAAVDDLAAGVLLTDAAGRVRYANRAAERLIADGDGLGVEVHATDRRPARLRAATSAATAALRERIARAAAAAEGGRDGGTPRDGGSRMLVARSPGRPPLSLLVVPLSPTSAARSPWRDVAARAAAIVLVTEVRGPAAGEGPAATPDARRHRGAPGLTAREHEVAALLTARRTNGEIAAALGVSPHTARHHTERVLQKLGVTSRRAVADRLAVARPPG